MIQIQLPRIIDPEQVKKAQQLIETHQRFVITVHMSPDGDAVGSALAAAAYLRAKGKEARVVFNDMPGDNLSFIAGIEEAVNYDRQNSAAVAALENAEVIFCLDYNALYRTGDMAKMLEASKAAKILIDHHLDPERDSFDVIISHPEMCATCELFYRFIRESGDDELLTPQMAEALYTGMMTDTGMFYYNSNRPEVYLIVARLLETGFDKERIHRCLTAEKERRMRLKGFVLQEKMQIVYPQQAAYFSLSRAELKRFNYQKGDSEGFVNMPLDVPGVVCSAYFREEANFVKVSLRSKGDYPVNIMAEKFFNGGGHKNAAGGEFLGSLQQAEQIFVKVLPMFSKYLNPEEAKNPNN
jgi:phosphoesterase RecJ-like protein